MQRMHLIIVVQMKFGIGKCETMSICRFKVVDGEIERLNEDIIQVIRVERSQTQKSVWNILSNWERSWRPHQGYQHLSKSQWFDIIKWTKTDLESIQRKTVTMPIRQRGHHPKSSVIRTTLPWAWSISPNFTLAWFKTSRNPSLKSEYNFDWQEIHIFMQMNSGEFMVGRTTENTSWSTIGCQQICVGSINKDSKRFSSKPLASTDFLNRYQLSYWLCNQVCNIIDERWTLKFELLNYKPHY